MTPLRNGAGGNQCVAISQVCHTWREIALQTEALWSTICLDARPECIALCLSRSGQMPKVVTSQMPMPNAPLFAYGNRHVPPSWFVHGLRYVLQQSRRIRVLALQLPNTIWEEALKTTYGGTFGPAPELRQITLLNSHSAPLPNIFPHEGLPSLQTLDIQGYHFLWHQPLLRLTTLSSLVIHNVYRPSLESFPRLACIMSGLLKVLSNNPTIKILVFQDEYCPREYKDYFVTCDNDSSPISLPFLEKLCIDSPATCINRFLTRCTFPRTTTVTLRAYGRERDSNFDKDTLDSIICHITNTPEPINGLTVAFDGLIPTGGTPSRLHGSVAFETYHFDPVTTTSFVDHLQLPPRVHFDFDCSYCDGLDHIIRVVSSDLDLSHISYLKLGLHPPDVQLAGPIAEEMDSVMDELASAMAGLISRCHTPGVSPGLQALRLDGAMLTMLPHILESMDHISGRTAYVANTSMTSHRSILPSLFISLHTLILADLDFSVVMPQGLFEGPYPTLTNVCDAIERQANRCRGACGNFSKLVIYKCRAPTNELYELVDSIADIVGQRGRFTIDPPLAPFLSIPNEPFGVPILAGILPPLVPNNGLEVLPDKDLDGLQYLPPLDTLAPVDTDLMASWDAYTSRCSVTFDFRGCLGIKIVPGVQSIA